MIGTNLRSIRHLFRVLDYTPKKALINFDGCGLTFCLVLKYKHKGFDYLVILNDKYKLIITDPPCDSNFYTEEFLDKIKEYNTNYKKFVIIQDCVGLNTSNKQYKLAASLIQEIVLLPDTFDDDYATFIGTNKKFFLDGSRLGIVDELGEETIKSFYVYSNGSRNFFQWACNLCYRYNVGPNTIRNILVWNDLYKQLVKQLSKKTITAYTSENDIKVLLKELTELRKTKRATDAINSFNTAQKKLLKSNNLAEIDLTTLAKFSKLSHVKRVNFIRKMSTVNDFQELMQNMRYMTNIHFEWNKSSFMDYLNNVEGLGYKIIFERDSIVLVEVKDFETIKKLGKTTNWCIAKNNSYWKAYTASNIKTKQYMIFDFSKLEDDKNSIIGFTSMYDKGIVHAHNFINEPLIGDEHRNFIFNELNSFFPSDNFQDIYSILEKYDIPISMVTEYEKPKYDWDKESFKKYLLTFVDEESVAVIKEEDGKLVLSVSDMDVKNAFARDCEADTFGVNPNEFILFVDFSMSQYDADSIKIAAIYENNNGVRGCASIYNSKSTRIQYNFEMLLLDYDVPYDIIKRPYNIEMIAEHAFFSYNVRLLKRCIDCDKKYVEHIFSSESKYDIINVILGAINDYGSLEYLNIMYDNGLTLSEYMESKYVEILISRLFDSLVSNYANGRFQTMVFNKPSESDIENFYKRNNLSKDKVLDIILYISILKIIENETKYSAKKIYGKILNKIVKFGFKGEEIDDIVLAIYEKTDMRKKNTFTEMIIFYFMENKTNEIFANILLSLIPKHTWMQILDCSPKKKYPKTLDLETEMHFSVLDDTILF